jgi:large subunit ribosomal protein L9
MQVVLLERVEKLGQMGDVVNVKNGFARNYLVPQGKAMRATKANLAEFERRRVQLEAANLQRKEEAQGMVGRIQGRTVVILRQAGEGGHLYGSVSPRDIAEALTGTGITITRQQVRLEAALKSLGMHQVRIALHPEVDTHITVNIARSPEEAEMQADPQLAAAAAEAEAAEAAEAEVEMGVETGVLPERGPAG